MRWPFVSRVSHDERIADLKAQIADLKQERLVLLDRLGLIGLGGPMFHLPTPEEVKIAEQVESKAEQDAAREIERIHSLRFTPSKRASYITRKSKREQASMGRAGLPWTPQAVSQAFDEVEKQA